MTDTGPASPAPRETDSWLEAGPTNVMVVYILYLVSLVIGVGLIVGVVVAYINRGKAGGWVDTHYTYAIRTFWIGLLYSVISVLLMFVMIGFLTAVATAIWFIARCVIGLQLVGRREPIKNPQSWLI
ncbi:MAG: hypothetical protein JNL61_13320 [Rhizobiaceae bacterium]|nr:hypothetical protein [Rhizobiaceae bacterium]